MYNSIITYLVMICSILGFGREARRGTSPTCDLNLEVVGRGNQEKPRNSQTSPQLNLPAINLSSVFKISPFSSNMVTNIFNKKNISPLSSHPKTLLPPCPVRPVHYEPRHHAASPPPFQHLRPQGVNKPGHCQAPKLFACWKKHSLLIVSPP